MFNGETIGLNGFGYPDFQKHRPKVFFLTSWLADQGLDTKLEASIGMISNDQQWIQADLCSDRKTRISHNGKPRNSPTQLRFPKLYVSKPFQATLGNPFTAAYES